MWNRVQWVFVEAFGRLGKVLADDLPGIVAMLVVVLAAVLIAFVIRGALRFALTRVGFDRRAREWGMTTGRGLEPHHEPSWLVARGAFWIVIATGFAIALAVLGASTTSALGISLLGLLPRLVVGGLLLLVGIGAARYLERGVLIGAVNQRIRRARLLAWGVKWIVLTFAAALALSAAAAALAVSPRPSWPRRRRTPIRRVGWRAWATFAGPSPSSPRASPSGSGRSPTGP